MAAIIALSSPSRTDDCPRWRMPVRLFTSGIVQVFGPREMSDLSPHSDQVAVTICVHALSVLGVASRYPLPVVDVGFE